MQVDGFPVENFPASKPPAPLRELRAGARKHHPTPRHHHIQKAPAILTAGRAGRPRPLLAGPAPAQTNPCNDDHYSHSSATWFTNFTTPPGHHESFGQTPWVIVTNTAVPALGGGRGTFMSRNGSPQPNGLPRLSDLAPGCLNGTHGV
jgi:hypothetical protein